MRLALAGVSLVALVGSGAVVYKETRATWQDHQKAYFAQAKAQAKSDAERVSLEGKAPKIEQTIVTAFGGTSVVRCDSWHIASGDRDGEPGEVHVRLFLQGQRPKHGRPGPGGRRGAHRRGPGR